MVNPIEAVANYFKNYVNFTGRSTRAEYWWIVLFSLVVGVIIGALEAILFGTHTLTTTSAAGRVGDTVPNSNLLSTITYLALIVPTIALIVRRIRDTGHHWAWIFGYLVPVLNIAVILFFAFKGSSPAGRGMPTSDKNPAGYWG